MNKREQIIKVLCIPYMLEHTLDSIADHILQALDQPQEEIIEEFISEFPTYSIELVNKINELVRAINKLNNK